MRRSRIRCANKTRSRVFAIDFACQEASHKRIPCPGDAGDFNFGRGDRQNVAVPSAFAASRLVA